jgi:hypothetical protein
VMRLPCCCQGACGLWMIVGGVWTGIHFAGAVAGGGGAGGRKERRRLSPCWSDPKYLMVSPSAAYLEVHESTLKCPYKEK